MKRAKAGNRRLGERLVAEFSDLRDALRAKKPLEKTFTVKTVEFDLRPKKFDAEAVRLIRLSLGVSQAIFAKLLGVSVDLVSAWEQGNRIPSGPVNRLLELMEADQSRWLKILKHGISRKSAST